MMIILKIAKDIKGRKQQKMKKKNSKKQKY